MAIINIEYEGTASLPIGNLNEDYIRERAIQILRKLEIENVSVSIILTDDEFIRRINHEYRNKDKATDVITFAYRDEPFPGNDDVPEEFGDIYISLDHTREQAEEYGHSMEQEFVRLLVHGLVHCAGYEHEGSEEDAEEMESLEELIINELNPGE